jgi:hypothetical protein
MRSSCSIARASGGESSNRCPSSYCRSMPRLTF